MASNSAKKPGLALAVKLFERAALPVAKPQNWPNQSPSFLLKSHRFGAASAGWDEEELTRAFEGLDRR